MIDSLILRTATRLLVPLLLLFSIYLLMEGHSAPGGGFPGGLIGAGAFALYAIAFGVQQARSALPAMPGTWIGGGILLILLSGAAPMVAGRPFLDTLWWSIPTPAGPAIDFGTPYLFEAGIYMVVAGTVLSIIFELEVRHTQLFAGADDRSGSAASASNRSES